MFKHRCSESNISIQFFLQKLIEVQVKLRFFEKLRSNSSQYRTPARLHQSFYYPCATFWKQTVVKKLIVLIFFKFSLSITLLRI